jgi:hypothetical protein
MEPKTEKPKNETPIQGEITYQMTSDVMTGETIYQRVTKQLSYMDIQVAHHILKQSFQYKLDYIDKILVGKTKKNFANYDDYVREGKALARMIFRLDESLTGSEWFEGFIPLTNEDMKKYWDDAREAEKQIKDEWKALFGTDATSEQIEEFVVEKQRQQQEVGKAMQKLWMEQNDGAICPSQEAWNAHWMKNKEFHEQVSEGLMNEWVKLRGIPILPVEEEPTMKVVKKFKKEKKA